MIQNPEGKDIRKTFRKNLPNIERILSQLAKKALPGTTSTPLYTFSLSPAGEMSRNHFYSTIYLLSVSGGGEEPVPLLLQYIPSPCLRRRRGAGNTSTPLDTFSLSPAGERSRYHFYSSIYLLPVSGGVEEPVPLLFH